MKFLLALLIVIGSAAACLSQSKAINLIDNSKLEVTDEQESEKASFSKISVKRVYFNAVFKSFGKAVPPLSENTLKSLKRTDKSLAAQIKKINSAYEMTQGDFQFYLATFNSVNYEDFKSCISAAPCKIECEAFVISLVNKSEKKNILIVKSIQVIR